MHHISGSFRNRSVDKLFFCYEYILQRSRTAYFQASCKNDKLYLKKFLFVWGKYSIKSAPFKQKLSVVNYSRIIVGQAKS